MQLLFSYGTLQQLDVQFANFGRKLNGNQDELVGFKQVMLEIKDPEVSRLSGKTQHPIVKQTGNREDRVKGTAFEVTEKELLSADEYEVADYKRVLAPLASGQNAWVYIDASQ